MKKLTLTTLAAATLMFASASSPALAGGYYNHGYHGGYYGGHHGGGSGGWWVAGALGLVAAGAIIAANQPTYAAPVYSAPVYSAPVYSAPSVYAAPPVYAAPAPQTEYAPPAAPSANNLIAYPSRGQTQAQQTQDRYQCQNWAVNQSGFDPSSVTQYSNNVQVDSYNRAMAACMTGRGYSVS